MIVNFLITQPMKQMDDGNCIICKVIVSVTGVIKKVSIKYKYNSLLIGKSLKISSVKYI